LPRIPHQGHPTPAIDSSETKIVGVRRHLLIALHPSPLGRLSGKRHQAPLVAGNLHHRDIVNINFDSAFAVATAACDRRSEIPLRLHLRLRTACGKKYKHYGE